MAIYIGISEIDEDSTTRFFEFHDADGESYGVLSVDLSSMECTLVESRHERCGFAFPRACRAIEREAAKGAIPTELSYIA
ncbi:MAG: hypothetical protein KDA93_16820 [Planctomycetaceae bacterium]|nr:hypothetical protein [Planctomycetaceae bacterium]